MWVEKPQVWIVTVDRPGHTDATLMPLRYRVEGTSLEVKARCRAAARAERPNAVYEDIYLNVEGDPALGPLTPNRSL